MKGTAVNKAGLIINYKHLQKNYKRNRNSYRVVTSNAHSHNFMFEFPCIV